MSNLREQIAAVRGAQHARRHQAQFDDGLSFNATTAADTLGDAVATLEQSADLQRTFDLRWDADQRAIGRWREAHPGNDMVWPDRCDMVVWLLGQLDEMKTALREPPEELRKAVAAAIRDRSTWGGYARDVGVDALRTAADWLEVHP